MHDSYPSFWSYLLWSVAGLFLLAGLAALTPAGKDDPKRGETFLGLLMLGGLLVGLGFWAQGSRSQDNLRKANVEVAQAERALAASIEAERAVTASSASAISTNRAMSFEACLGTIDTVAREFGRPIEVVNSTDLRIVRILTSEGSVLVTCSRPDQKMVITKSARGY